jgi:hypothetical protein
MVAMTHEAYAKAWEVAQTQDEEAWAMVRGKGRAAGDMIHTVLKVLESEGVICREERVPIGTNIRWPVFALVPARQVAPPSLTLVKGGVDEGPP